MSALSAACDAVDFSVRELRNACRDVSVWTSAQAPPAATLRGASPFIATVGQERPRASLHPSQARSMGCGGSKEEEVEEVKEVQVTAGDSGVTAGALAFFCARALTPLAEEKWVPGRVAQLRRSRSP